MRSVYEITADPSAPRLELIDLVADLATEITFDGRPKAEAWPRQPPEVRCDVFPESAYVFYQFAPGALVVAQQALTLCEDFYWVTQDGCEPLALRCGARQLEVIHPVSFLPAGQSTPCPVDRYYSALFRIEGKESHRLFCAAGVGVAAANEFKSVYDQFGFTGLRFTEVWRG